MKRKEKWEKKEKKKQFSIDNLLTDLLLLFSIYNYWFTVQPINNNVNANDCAVLIENFTLHEGEEKTLNEVSDWH